jgi:hypothetical protein
MMQKFSNVVGQKVNLEPKIEISKETLEVESFKQSILELIEKTLIVRNEGSYKHAMIVTQIDGKEMFVEALIDFLSEKENKKAITYLESLKESNTDWKSIDDKISQIKIDSENLKFLNDNAEHVEQIKSFLEKYSASQDFNDILDSQLLKVTDYETAATRAKVATIMLQIEKYNKYPKGMLRSISYKFAYRANQLNNQ